ncbi:MAG: NAD(P)-binding domain-containing protein, partial [Alicyclobacillaceae bacterium]|nr:NAD(P)-binding domain-containing protein [Alicyclobacillaceae bacterium]
MKLGLIGLGKMGYHLVLNLMEHGHQVVGFDVNADTVARLAQEGGIPADSISHLVQQLPAPRTVWLMVPHGKVIDDLLSVLVPELTSGDIVIDGGNSYYKETMRRHQQLRQRGIHLLDVGTSGGIEGARHGAC